MSDERTSGELEQPPQETGARPSGRAVVAIGASAGGLAALRTFFEHVPRDSGLSYVVVVHLSPSHESHLADLLQGSAHIPVTVVTEPVALDADQVYVIPPGANLEAIDSHVRPSKIAVGRVDRAPIDHFFRTLAATHEGRCIGVILSGTGSDGALGIKEIKGSGGLTIVQDPREAEFDGMPQSAIVTGMVDLVLPLEKIPDAAISFARTEPRLQPVNDDEALEEASAQRILLQKLLAQVRARTGRDFSRYKPSTVQRRIERRMQLGQIEQLDTYLALVRESPEEVKALADDLLITVTNFFRDREVWDRIEEEVVPRLFEGKSARDRVRVWSVGCATGEEAYSLAILLLEEAYRRDLPPQIQIFASDLHEHSLERAREGFYPGDIEPDVTADRLRRFFIREDGGYRVRKEVRELIVFAPHNLLTDPPFSRLDLVSCRNVLIYLQRDVQREVLELFHYALGPDGVLLLGTSETVDGSELFRTESKKYCFFRKRNIRLPEPRLPHFPLSRLRGPTELRGAEPVPDPIAYGVLHQRMVERYAPPSLLLSGDHRVVHLSENVGRYLVHPGGELTSSAFKLVREELRLELRAALHTVREENRPVRTSPIPMRFDGKETYVSLDVRGARDADQEGLFLVSFDEQEAPPRHDGGSGRAVASDDERVQQVEAELEQARQRLQAIIEEYETSQEEMKASHEELQSANEELRSTLEELETSKEELQSMNEELQTVNQENRHKVEELAQLSGDLQNLLSSTDIATLFLDRELRILRFTPQVGELFNIRPVDRGRPLSDLTHRLGYSELKNDAESVLRRLIPVEREVQDEKGRWYLTRLLPYRSTQDRIEGVVITFTEITGRKRTEEALQASERNFRAIADLVPDLLWHAEPSGRILWYNGRWMQYTGQSAERIAGEGWLETVHPEDRAGLLDTFRTPGDGTFPLRREVRLKARDNDFRWFLVQALPLPTESGEVQQWFGAATDIHEHRTALEAAQAARAEAESANRALEEARAELETRVVDRTGELAETNRRLAEEIRERERAEQVRTHLLRQLSMAEEAERRRLSRELHDQMGQLLTALMLELQAISRTAGDDAAATRLGEAEKLAERIAREVQHLALELRPPALDNLGLKLALQSHLEEWSERHGIQADFQSIGPDDPRLPPEVDAGLYRVVQEGLTNVAKHAAARRVSLVLERRSGFVNVILEDDGRGLDVEAAFAAPVREGHLGLQGMRERVMLLGGTLEIDSSEAGGTTIFARIPMSSTPNQEGAELSQ